MQPKHALLSNIHSRARGCVSPCRIRVALTTNHAISCVVDAQNCYSYMLNFCTSNARSLSDSREYLIYYIIIIIIIICTYIKRFAMLGIIWFWWRHITKQNCNTTRITPQYTHTRTRTIKNALRTHTTNMKQHIQKPHRKSY